MQYTNTSDSVTNYHRLTPNWINENRLLKVNNISITFQSFAANISAINQIWVMGDTTLVKGIPTFQQMKVDNSKNREIPYLYEYFDVHSFYPILGDRLNRSGGNPIIRMYNSFMEAINTFNKLPKYIIVVFDYNFIKEVDTKQDIDLMLLWLMKEIMKNIEIRKDQLPKKAIDPVSPKLVFTKMLPMSQQMDQTNQFKAKRRLFNKSLEEIVSRIKQIACLNIDAIIPFKREHYSLTTGLLSEIGYQIFWEQLNLLMRKLDHDIKAAKITQCTISSTFTAPASVNPRSIYQYQISDVQTDDRSRFLTPSNSNSNTNRGRGRGCDGHVKRTFEGRRPFYNHMWGRG